jgi:hypothetical protein
MAHAKWTYVLAPASPRILSTHILRKVSTYLLKVGIGDGGLQLCDTIEISCAIC